MATISKFMQQTKKLLKQYIKDRKKYVHALCQKCIKSDNPKIFIIKKGRKNGEV